MTKPRSLLRNVGDRLYRHSVKDNLRLLKRKISPPNEPDNTVAEALLAQQSANQLYLNWKVGILSDEVALIGQDSELEMVTDALKIANKSFQTLDAIEQGQSGRIDPALTTGLHSDTDILVCRWPGSPQQWEAVARLRASVPNRVWTLQELMLPMAEIKTAQQRLGNGEENLERLMRNYTGQEYLGPLKELDTLCPIKGKRVIELGPLDGGQTAGLVHLGAKEVTCIEARAENALKTLAAKSAFYWSNVTVVMDDFHNVSGANYGRFDLAFAHGVYYHSFSPFLFFENLFSLADQIFFGGYVATDLDPPGEFINLEYRGESYQAKSFADGFGVTAGVNLVGYYFADDDVRRLFINHGFEIIPLSNDEQFQATGRFLRFLARRADTTPET